MVTWEPLHLHFLATMPTPALKTWKCCFLAAIVALAATTGPAWGWQNQKTQSGRHKQPRNGPRTVAEQMAQAYQVNQPRLSPEDSDPQIRQDSLRPNQVQALPPMIEPPTPVGQPEAASQVPASQQEPVIEFKHFKDPRFMSVGHPQLTQGERAETQGGRAEQENPVPQTQVGDFWWDEKVARPFEAHHEAEFVGVDQLLYRALQNSQQIQFISKDPLIRELEIVEADSEFDPAMYARSVYDDRVDPVGNSLTTGGAPFLKDNVWTAEAGIRKKLRTGGQLELEQSLGFQNSNSRFFVPQDQGTATLSLNYNQPLLRGAGRQFNRSQILLAQRSTDLAWDTFSVKLQDELLAVVEAYWDLYFRRAVFLQKQRNVSRGEAILKKIEGRAALDSLPSQVTRARSEVQSRRTELANAFRDVRNAETEIRRLLSDPEWLAKQSLEMVPSEVPSTKFAEPTLKQVIYDAMQHRPEIRAAVQKAKLAALQTNILTNELLPELTLLFSSYISALEGDTGIERAWQGQFSADPGVSVGLEFEFPYKNRAARSRHTRSKIQLSKIHHEIQQTTHNVVAETQVAFRRVVSAAETLKAARLAVSAARIDLNQNHKRWQNFALIEGDIAEGQTPTLVLDQLLDSQQRLADAEFTYSQALKELKVSEVGLRRATGTLLIAKEIQVTKERLSDQPTLRVHRPMESSQSAPHYPPANAHPTNSDSPAIQSLPSQQNHQSQFQAPQSKPLMGTRRPLWQRRR